MDKFNSTGFIYKSSFLTEHHTGIPGKANLTGHNQGDLNGREAGSQHHAALYQRIRIRCVLIRKGNQAAGSNPQG